MARALAAGPAGGHRIHARSQQARLQRCVTPRCAQARLDTVSTSAPTSVDSATVVELGWRPASDLRKEYVLGKPGGLGVGSFGSVSLGVNVRTGLQVAVKTLPKERPRLSRARVLEKLNRELTLLERLADSPNSIQLLDWFEDEDNCYLVTEACLGGDLQQFSDKYGALSERCLAEVATEVLKVVRSCHRLGVLHGDVKPANFCILQEHVHPYAASPAALHRTPWLKAIDFGCSQLHHRHTRLTKRSGTPVYMAPEVFRRDYSFEVDVWSTGVLLYQLYCRQFPFWHGDSYNRALSLDEVAQAITEADIRMDFGPWLTMSPQGLDFVRGCLTRNPADRLTIDEALAHPWLQAFTAGAGHAGLAGPLVETELPVGAVANNIVRSPLLQARRDAAMAA
ncbi:Calcium-dependent protein kinase 34 [Tetrabaena socialis]|uniref:Calcium-dependent protein kinase 34 n=1 Tax=Tetrabaena socialis TaxID=47790 RepID=A0A2J8A3A4_9CHLO|nr:Calcium-dependent protein kinase 34 [Tetrabaena socialis]|eukprot:PNH06983.1 Calcium-dependent protein kinase 34 [Tetrabaena socialis]